MRVVLGTTKDNKRVLFIAGENDLRETVEFEPTEKLIFYTWNDKGEIFIDELRKAEIQQKIAALKEGQQAYLKSPAYRIAKLKKQLADMDYKTSKRLDGDYTDEQWEQIAAERRGLRQQIRELDGEINDV